MTSYSDWIPLRRSFWDFFQYPCTSEIKSASVWIISNLYPAPNFRAHYVGHLCVKLCRERLLGCPIPGFWCKEQEEANSHASVEHLLNSNVTLFLYWYCMYCIWLMMKILVLPNLSLLVHIFPFLSATYVYLYSQIFNHSNWQP